MDSSRDYWVHDLDPVAIHLFGDLAVRWYGLAYAAAFLIGAGLLWLYEKKGKSPLNGDQQSNVIFAIIIGVLLGGRLGYVLLYDLPRTLQDPLSIFRVWEGGMSSHGGFLGVTAALVWISRKYEVGFFRLGDLVCSIVPVGLLLGRLANFINGELWGTVSRVPWAVVFPQSAPPEVPISQIPPRHPSQLYEAALEGALLLAYMQWRFWKSGIPLRKPGQLSGEFLILYAIGRIIAEQFREPDASLILGMSRGIFYSVFILAAGGAVIWFARERARTAPRKKSGKA